MKNNLRMTPARAAQRAGTLRFRAKEGWRASRVETTMAPRHPQWGGARLDSRPRAGRGNFRVRVEYSRIACTGDATSRSRTRADGGTAVDDAADQAWASATPITIRPPDRRTPDPAGSRGPARTGCHRA